MTINVTPTDLDRIIADGGGTLKRHTIPAHPVLYGPQPDFEPWYLPKDIPTTGFFVGVYNLAVITPPSKDYHDVRFDLAATLPDIVIPDGFRKHSDTYYVGLWRDENGDWYIDVSMHYPDYAGAVLEATAIHEKAIWDIANAREIRIPDLF